MYSLLNEIDNYLKENNIPYKTIIFNKSYLPDYINLAIHEEMKKASSMPFIKVSPEYELRHDKNGILYMLVRNDRNRELFIISKPGDKIEEDFKHCGRSEKHITKWGCLFKLLKDDVKAIKEEINDNYKYLNFSKRSRIEYELIDELLENKYKEFVRDNKFIENEINYEEDLIESTYLLKDYIRYLYNYYNEGIVIKKK